MGLEQKEYVQKRIAYLESGRGDNFDKSQGHAKKPFQAGGHAQKYNSGEDMQFVKSGKRFDDQNDQAEKRVKY